MLCSEDTSELDDTRKPSMPGLGPLNLETRQGLYLHPTLAVTPERRCLGLLNVHRWVREPGRLGQDQDPKRALEEPVLTATTCERPASHGVKARTVHQELRAVRVDK